MKRRGGAPAPAGPALLAGLSALCVSLLLGAAPAARAETVDRVVAVVGNRPVLLSSVEEEVRLLRLQEGGSGAAPDSVLYSRALERLIDDLLILAKADLQAIEVSESEVDEAIETTLSNMRRQFGSEEAFQRQLAKEGLTEAALRERYREDLRNQIKGSRLVDKEIRSKVAITEEEINAFYTQHQAEIPILPRRLEIAQIVVRMKPDEGARQAAIAKIGEARARLAAGDAFEEVAKKYSEGPSAARGGDLGTFRPGSMEKAFEDAVHALSPGEVSPPVETRVGIHLIRLDEKREDGTVHAHHIIALFSSGGAARDSARARIEAAVAEVQAGGDFAEIAARVSDDEETGEKGGRVGLFAAEEMPEEYRALVQDLEPGGLSPIHESEEGFVVFRLNRIEEPRKPTLEEVRREVREALKEEKVAADFNAYVQRLRKEIYVRIL